MSRARASKHGALIAAFGLAALALLPACSGMNTLTRGECMEENRTFLIGLPLTGTRSFNRECAEMHSADLLTQTTDPGLKAIGYDVLKKVSPVFKKSDEEHLRRMVDGPAPMQCEFAGIDPQTKRAHYRNCRAAQPEKSLKP